ncbi:MAG: RHS repeat-associated core domain-containing protein [Candidatus Eremiobacteraeota bacterium]|nr:RHS repeat-associated core domain-containing protein [Candidatus Eremiobacteraeota bacterium]MCW5871079.1 RHS repeat-associated core domain-containing protein [Candidatus Eremiobacteraeota bacterium]
MNHMLFPQPIRLDGFQTILGSCSDVEMLRVSIGNLVRRYTVAQVASVGPALKFELTHNARESFSGTLGPSWRHNWMAHLEFGSSLVTYEDGYGRRHNFTASGSDWVLNEGNSLFLRQALTEVSGQWHLKGFANGEDMVFDSGGKLLQVVDSHGQALTLHYTSSLLTAVEEPTGRQITLAYSSGLLTSITDPRGHVTSFVYGADSKLASIIGPEGCMLSYEYASGATNGRIVARTDARNNRYTYSYDGSGRLLTVTNPASKTISYAYGTVQERLSSPHFSDFKNLSRVILTDAEAKNWEYRFDDDGNLWRILDPLTHNRRFYWSNQQELLYVAEGYGVNQANELGPQDSPHNRFNRFMYDGLGNQTAHTDPNGIITQREYDAEHRLITVTPARATNQIGGNWFDHFGKDGFVMCSGLDDSSDLVQLPSYIDSAGILPGEEADGSNAFVRSLPNLESHRIDTRAPWIRLPGSPPRDTYRRSLGMWKTEEESKSFTFRIPVQVTGAFNLSFYTHAADYPFASASTPGYEKTYSGVFGRDVEILVTDFDPLTGEPRRQVFRQPNNAAGCWISFGVYAEAESSIRVVVRTRADISETEFPCINMIAFDPIEQRTTNLYYTGVDLTSVVDPLHQVTSFEYNLDGTLKKVTDAKNRDTEFFYEDAAKNLTRIVDAASGEVVLGYDANGNVTRSEDQDTRVSTMVYDAKNRLIQITDPLNHSTHFRFDGAGNLVSVRDARGRQTFLAYDNLNRLTGVSNAAGQETFFAYNGSGRLIKVTDALGRETEFSYDAAGRLVQTEMADGQKVLYALNAVNRLVSITGPNASQADWDQIDLTGALDVLNDGSVEAPVMTWQHTDEYDYGINPLYARTNLEAHSGTYSLPVVTGKGRYLNDITTYAGGRYVAKAWAKKAGGGAPTVAASIAAEVRNFEATLETQTEPGQATAVDTDWTELKPQMVQIPGDTLAVRTQPPLRKLKFLVEKTSPSDEPNTAYLDDASLHLINTCLEYDGVNLREVGTPDGARFRREFDRVGRLCRLSDPQGRVIYLNYDSLDRVVSVRDSLGLTLAYAYDETGQLVSFTDAKNQVMTFAYDDLDRLLTITYPDSSTEEFEYSAAGDLLKYTDNLAQERSFDYDFGHRLTGVTYPNLDRLVLAYDEVNNLVSRTERNGDVESYSYDKLNRVTRCKFTPDSGSDSSGWDLTSRYDEVGNRTRLANTGGVRYDTGALYGTAHYGQNTPIWSVPEEGFDEMNRLVEFQDSEENSTTFGYDLEGRRTSVRCPNGTLTQATYDIVGKLLQLRTSKEEEELLELNYDYNLAGDRLAQQSEKASCTYHLDKSGRLVEETINRWVTGQADHLAQGILQSCRLDSANARVQLLDLEDTFETLNLDRWRPSMVVAPVALEPRLLGNEMRVNEGLHMVYPSTWSAFQSAYIPDVAWYGAGMGPKLRCRTGHMSNATQELVLRRPLVGDFDLVLEWDGFEYPEGILTDPMKEEYPEYQYLGAFLENTAGQMIHLQRRFYWAYSTNNYYNWNDLGASGSPPASGSGGKFRLARVGSTVKLYFWDEGEGDWEMCGTGRAFPGDLVLKIRGYCQLGCMNYRILSLSHLGVNPVRFPLEGSYESVLYDAGRTVQWQRLAWAEELETATDVKFQLAFSENPAGPWAYIGPDGTAGTFFSSPAGEVLDETPDFAGRYARFKALLSSDGLATPKFGEVHLSFWKAGMLASEVRNYRYDEAGNIERVTTVTDAGSTTDERTYNDLNQLTEQVVGGDTWEFSYDDNGNMTEKSNGIETWAYVWSDENRLVQVNGTSSLAGFGMARFGGGRFGGNPGSVTIDYTYDSMGRMLTRNDGANLTTFVWDHWDMIREVTGESETVYHIPQGQILSFVRDGVTYQAHSDALGSIRMITDEAGEVVARYEYSGFGEAISVTEDSALIDFPMRFVGSLGVRFDELSGLIYMRQRWYDKGLARFLSKDPIGLQGSFNLYAYAENDPASISDPSGLRPPDLGLMRSKPRSLTAAEATELLSMFKRIGCAMQIPPEMLMAIWRTEGQHFMDDGLPPNGWTSRELMKWGANIAFSDGASIGFMGVSPTTAAYLDGQLSIPAGKSWPDFTSSERRSMFKAQLTPAQRVDTISNLENPFISTLYAAKNINYLKDQLFPGKTKAQMTDDDWGTIGDWYNMGASAPAPGKPHGTNGLNVIKYMRMARQKKPEYCECR